MITVTIPLVVMTQGFGWIQAAGLAPVPLAARAHCGCVSRSDAGDGHDYLEVLALPLLDLPTVEAAPE
jgi:hypothetical protein